MQIQLENTTQKLCVIGDPVLHSRSPLIQNTMIKALGLDYVYLCQPVAPERLEDFLHAAALLGYKGFNATMPHKQALLPQMDVLDGDAARFGAVNTVCIRDGKYYGYNTDGAGFIRALADEGITPSGLRVTLLGAGGAAKAVALKLACEGAGRVTICNRTIEKAQALCGEEPGGVLFPAGFDGEALRRAAEGSDLLVNCTSLGMEGTAGQFECFSFLDALPPHAAVCDLIYSPPKTALLCAAEARGHSIMNGLGLLLHQAILSLEHFTGTEIDPARMKACLKGVVSA